MEEKKVKMTTENMEELQKEKLDQFHQLSDDEVDQVVGGVADFWEEVTDYDRLVKKKMVCPICGGVGEFEEYAFGSKSTVWCMFKCRECKEQFQVMFIKDGRILSNRGDTKEIFD